MKRSRFSSSLFSHLGVRLGDALQDLVHAARALPAGDALAAGLLGGESQEVLGHVHHAGVLVHDHQAPGAHHGPDGLEALVVDPGVQVLRRDAAAGGAAALHGFEGLAPGDAPAYLEDDLPQGRAHGHLHQAGVLHLAGQGEHLGALGGRGAHGGEGRDPLARRISRHVAEGLHIDDRGAAEQAGHSREGGPQPGHAPPALERGHQGGLLARTRRPLRPASPSG